MFVYLLNMFQLKPEIIIWVFPLCIAIHELEEWNILKWYRKHYSELPPSTNRSIQIHILSFILLASLLASIGYFIPSKWVISPIAVYFSFFLVTNTLQHIIWTIQYKAYSPGLITGLFAIIVIVFINVYLVNRHLIQPVFYFMFILIAKPLISTLKSRGTMTAEILKVHLFFLSVDKLLFGRLNEVDNEN